MTIVERTHYGDYNVTDKKELTMQEKALTMVKIGLIMQRDFNNEKRIDERWEIFQNTKQLTTEEVLNKRNAPAQVLDE